MGALSIADRAAAVQEPEPSERVSPSCDAAGGRPSGTETSGATGPTGGLDCPLVATAASGAACGRAARTGGAAGGCCSVELASIVSACRRTERAPRRNRLRPGGEAGGEVETGMPRRAGLGTLWGKKCAHKLLLAEALRSGLGGRARWRSTRACLARKVPA